MAKKNPVLEKVRREAYQEGFRDGLEHGKYAAVCFFAERFERLEKTKGIGAKTMQRIVEAIGVEYFESRDSRSFTEGGRTTKKATHQKTT